MSLISVVSCEKENNYYRIIVKNSDFYPDGKGGQLGDRGKIGEVLVLEVLDENTILVKEYLSPGNYSFEIDNRRRLDISIQHTAQHLFSAIAYNDYELNTVGFRMSEQYSTVDLDIKDISSFMVDKLEEKVNEFIGMGSHVLINILPLEEANQLSSLRKKISDKVKEDVRIIEIEGIDTSACAGFHVENIKDLRVFKIINWEKIKGNYTRFYFLAGNRAIHDYKEKNYIIKKLNTLFSCQDYEIISMVDKFLTEKKNCESELKNILSSYSELLSEKLLSEAIYIENLPVIIHVGDLNLINNLNKNIDPTKYLFIGIHKNGGAISSELINCGEFVKYISSLDSNIKGGGKSSKANFKGDIGEAFILDSLQKFLKL